jgi:hypothetical protein
VVQIWERYVRNVGGDKKGAKELLKFQGVTDLGIGSIKSSVAKHFQHLATERRLADHQAVSCACH